MGPEQSGPFLTTLPARSPNHNHLAAPLYALGHRAAAPRARGGLLWPGSESFAGSASFSEILLEIPDPRSTWSAERGLTMTTDTLPFNVGRVLHEYLVCALWSSCDENDVPFDRDHDIEDLAPESVKESREVCVDFLTTNQADLEASGLDESQIGYDLWLTRNGHGAGFWDRGLGEIGDRLSDMSKPYGEGYVYKGDDDQLYIG